MRSSRARAAENLQHLRRLVPVPLIPTVVRRRIDRIWSVPEFREGAEQSMEFLLGRSERAHEVDELARGYAEHMLLRSYRRWHPRSVTNQRVRDAEWLTAHRDPARGILLSFAHHAHYDGLFGSLAHHGVAITAVMTPDMMSRDAPIAFRQHYAVVRRGAHVIPSTTGSDAFADLLRGGATLAIASDVPGRTPVTFLGRRVLGSFGAARLATTTNSPVVVVTTLRDHAGPYLQVHAPLEPGDYADPADLLTDLLERHAAAVLAWPEAFESPPARFGVVEP